MNYPSASRQGIWHKHCTERIFGGNKIPQNIVIHNSFCEENNVYWWKNRILLPCNCKGLERPRLIVLTGAGSNHAWTTTKASAHSVEPRRDDYIKGICSTAQCRNLWREQYFSTKSLQNRNVSASANMTNIQTWISQLVKSERLPPTSQWKLLVLSFIPERLNACFCPP